jgi:hypothetical protein
VVGIYPDSIPIDIPAKRCLTCGQTLLLEAPLVKPHAQDCSAIFSPICYKVSLPISKPHCSLPSTQHNQRTNQKQQGHSNNSHRLNRSRTCTKRPRARVKHQGDGVGRTRSLWIALAHQRPGVAVLMNRSNNGWMRHEWTGKVDEGFSPVRVFLEHWWCSHTAPW